MVNADVVALNNPGLINMDEGRLKCHGNVVCLIQEEMY